MLGVLDLAEDASRGGQLFNFALIQLAAPLCAHRTVTSGGKLQADGRRANCVGALDT